MQEKSRLHLQKLLGVRLSDRAFLESTTLSIVDHGTWTLEDLILTTTGGEDIPAFFACPKEVPAPVPAVIYAHAHGNTYDLGRGELVQGRGSLVRPYAEDLVSRGIAALCMDMPCFGERQEPDESTLSKTLFWHGRTLFGQMLAELAAGVSFLSDHAAVDADRLGALGFSMGSTHAFWLAALDTRIRAASALCSFADLGALVTAGAHDGHGHYMTVPGLLSHTRTGQIAGLAAPRALQICVGLQDWSTPAEAFRLGQQDLEEAYRVAGASDKLEFHVEPDLGHRETPAMRKAVLDFLDRNLVAR